MSDSTDALTVVRAHFDEVLGEHITTILDMDALPAGLVLNIATIVSLVLFVERESERDEFSDSPPLRYTRDSFFLDIREIGLGADSGVMGGLEPLLNSGLVKETEDGFLKPEPLAHKMLQVINTLFPGMQGMNFVAYVVQTIDEVVSDRKDLHDAKRFFLQTLQMHSLAGQVSELSRDRVANPKKGTVVTRDKRAVSTEWNRNVLQKLSRLRSQRGASRTEELQIREVFIPDRNEDEDPEAPSSGSGEKEELVSPVSSEVHAFAEDFSVPSPVIELSEMEESADESLAEDSAVPVQTGVLLADPVTEVPDEEELAPSSEEPPASSDNEEVAVPDFDPEPVSVQEASAPSEAFLPPETDVGRPEEENQESLEEVMDDRDIEARIAAFEETLALTCPLCKTGKLQENQTEKGKVFYDCSQSSCHFISWSQPFHYPCPTCANPFLIAFTSADGKEGLKCPRATCDYSQDERINPEEYQRKKKKKRKIVRRVKRKA
ncbi:topoisomerase DNA-binding C4 zinc finger domain-containing protein [Desulfobotulus sp. H1]|uniref:Topoisomerase DNA-binding C4 zinc finger domain-containing protein n=1 Tax=Desulfobotulus pelophilus TaxID=2823377 RepID=A0ABT3NA75_9BACT|nr:type I DNA topoisomerase [Desulfobotulus pelophilus]MCW7754081.1 topoisomerase DNA-binding C4 zinc finger domain-containing protein [Desulfobotulus pelophilus]